jgi:hypothetical protein
MLFNSLYVGCTRAKDLLIFCEDGAASLQNMLYKDVLVKNDYSEIMRYLHLDNSEIGWANDAAQNERYRRYKEAIIAYREADRLAGSGRYNHDIRRCLLLQSDTETHILFGKEKTEARRRIAHQLFKIGEFKHTLQIYTEVGDHFHSLLTALSMGEQCSLDQVKAFADDEQFCLCDTEQWSLVSDRLVAVDLMRQADILSNLKNKVKAV